MEKIILDASVVIKWFVEEERGNKALQILHQVKERKISLIVPELLFYEIGNTLLSKNATLNDVIDIIAKLNNLPIELADVGYSSFRKVFQNAQKLELTFYDASYITLMQNKDCEFVTADKKLYEKVKGKFARIKLL